MRRATVLVLALGLVLAVTACGGSDTTTGGDQQAQQNADLLAIDEIEKTWHKAASNHDVDLMMSIWAPDATFTIGTETYSGTAQIREFFKTAGPFQPDHHWLSETPAYKVRITVNGDKGTISFECHYVDIATKQVVSVVAADQKVEKIDGKWLITSSAAATAELAA